jgi:hypothetical protein
MKQLTRIKIGAAGQELPADATDWVAVKFPELDIMEARGNLSDKQLDDEDTAAALAKFKLAGFDNWREPELIESQIIVDTTRYNPACDPAFFSDTKSNWYRTCTATPWSSGRVFFVYFGGGSVHRVSRNGEAFCRPVRSLVAGQ